MSAIEDAESAAIATTTTTTTTTVNESTPSKKRRHVSFAANLVSAVVDAPSQVPDGVVVADVPLSDRALVWLAQVEAIDLALSQFQSRQQVALLSKVATWVAAATKRSFGIIQLGEILSIAPEFYQLSRLVANNSTGNAAMSSIAIATAAPLEPQLQLRRVEFRSLLAHLSDDAPIVPVDVLVLARGGAISSPPPPQQHRRRRIGDNEDEAVDDQSPLRSAIIAQRRIDALLGHPDASATTAAAAAAAADSLHSHAALADQRGRELAALASRHFERQPLLSAADNGIDVLRSKFSLAKRASLPLDEVLSALQVGLALSVVQAAKVLEHLLAAVPLWISKAQFGANEFVSIKPLSIMSTNAAHDAFLAFYKK